MDYQKLAAAIVKNVGGEENIQMVNHCMTRLRFNLKDVSKADKAALEDLNGVLGVVYAGEQYMVILGQHLIPTYKEIVTNANGQTIQLQRQGRVKVGTRLDEETN